MAPLVVLTSVGKFLGVAGSTLVVLNALMFRRFRKKLLKQFPNPIDDTQEVLAIFPIDVSDEDDRFFFGLATAPAHVEDDLDDAWLEFAKATVPTSTEGAGNAGPIGPGSIQETGTDETQEDIVDDKQRALQIEASGGGNEMTAVKREDQGRAEGLPEWELVSSEADAAEDKKTSAKDVEQERERSGGESKKKAVVSGRAKGSGIEAVQLRYGMPRHLKKFANAGKKVALEAFMRGITSKKESEVKGEASREGQEGDEGVELNVAAWHNVERPEERVRFWSEPEIELELAAGTNSTVFRMGIDWGRLVPVEPADGMAAVVDKKAVERYRYILGQVHQRGMKVMLSLFHHSLPKWAAKYGGWRDSRTIGYFAAFTRLAVEEFGSLVDYWITFNEPHVFTMLTYCAGEWPGGDPHMVEQATAVMPNGIFNTVMEAIAQAHNESYDIIHSLDSNKGRAEKVGVSHHVSFMRPYGLFDVPAVVFSHWMCTFAFVDAVCHKLDWIGINYYGQEFVSLPGLKLVSNEEYSDAGRGVYPDGLYRMLLLFHERYRKWNVTYMITENGVADATDVIRQPYIIEHLLAVRAAMDKGVPVQGYLHWTVSDNWEWADGYGPKFGLVAVDRENNLARTKRPSYDLFAEIAKTGRVTQEQRERVWAHLQDAAGRGETRPFSRQVDSFNLMYAGGLDMPVQRPFIQRDWRFGHYEPDGLQDYVSITFRFLQRLLLLGWRPKRKSLKFKGAAKQGDSKEGKKGTPGLTEKPLPTGNPQVDMPEEADVWEGQPAFAG